MFYSFITIYLYLNEKENEDEIIKLAFRIIYLYLVPYDYSLV